LGSWQFAVGRSTANG